MEGKVALPEGADVSIQQGLVTFKGPKGQTSKRFNPYSVTIEKREKELFVESDDAALFGTVCAHLRNLVKGVTEGYTKKLQIVYSHFPATVEVKGDSIIIKNFLGEKKPRTAKVVGTTKLECKGTIVTLSGCSKEDVGQTAANIMQAVRIRKKDSRVFQDGLYPTE